MLTVLWRKAGKLIINKWSSCFIYRGCHLIWNVYYCFTSMTPMAEGQFVLAVLYRELDIYPLH